MQESKATGYPNDCPVISYDFQAPVGDMGQLRESWHRLKTIHQFVHSFGEMLAPMLPVMPEEAPASLEDTQTLRCALRTDGEGGFLFVNNHIRLQKLPAHPAQPFTFLFREDSLLLPWAPELGEITGFRFHYWQESQLPAAAFAREAALRMCLISPAGMTKFTLTDPEQLGESFSGLAALDPGGKLWGSLRSDPDDIERALRELAKHITDVNQRCLRGEFANLAEYNRSGAGIPEKFRMLVLMDYPMGLTERSMELLEQILRSGPKCGVLPFVFVNGSMMLKCSETRRKRALDLISDMPMLRMDAAGSAVTLDADKIQGGSIFYHSAPMPEQKLLKQMLDARRQDD